MIKIKERMSIFYKAIFYIKMRIPKVSDIILSSRFSMLFGTYFCGYPLVLIINFVIFFANTI